MCVCVCVCVRERESVCVYERELNFKMTFIPINHSSLTLVSTNYLVSNKYQRKINP